MILGYYSDRLSKRLGNSAESTIAPGASRNDNEPGTSKGGAPEVPVLNLARAGSSIEPRGQSRSSEDLGGSPMSLRGRRSRMVASNKAFLSESQEGAEASPPHGQTPPYRWNRPGTTISISPRETPEGSRNFAISFQEKKEEGTYHPCSSPPSPATPILINLTRSISQQQRSVTVLWWGTDFVGRRVFWMPYVCRELRERNTIRTCESR